MWIYPFTEQYIIFVFSHTTIHVTVYEHLAGLHIHNYKCIYMHEHIFTLKNKFYTFPLSEEHTCRYKYKTKKMLTSMGRFTVVKFLFSSHLEQDKDRSNTNHCLSLYSTVSWSVKVIFPLRRVSLFHTK